MDKSSGKRLKNDVSNTYRKMKTEQSQPIYSSAQSPQMINSQNKQKELFNLKRQFDIFKGNFQKSITQGELLNTNISKRNSMTTPNLLKYSKGTYLKIKKDDSNKNKTSLEDNLRKILEDSVEREDQSTTKNQNKNNIVAALKLQLEQIFNHSIAPILKNINQVYNKTIKLQEFTSRLKYIYRKKQSKVVSGKGSRQIPIFGERKIKRRSVQSEIEQKESISTGNYIEDKRILQISLRSLLQQEKTCYESISKKDRLIDLLVDQIQQLELKYKTDVQTLEQQLVFQESQHSTKMKKMNEQLSEMKGTFEKRQYVIYELEGKNKATDARCNEIQIQLSKLLQLRMQEIVESNALKDTIKLLQLNSKQNQEYTNKIKRLENHIQRLTEQLANKDRDLEQQKRKSEGQYRSMEKELRDIDQGFTTIKAANEILKRKQIQYQKEIKGLKKQLTFQRQSVRKDSAEEQDYYSLLQKNRVDEDIEELENKVKQLEKLLEQSEVQKLKLIEHRSFQSQNHSQEVYRSLKQFIVKLEGQIVERDRRIWQLESNISRVKQNKPELPTLFSPKNDKHSTPDATTKKQTQSNESGQYKQINTQYDPKMIESVIINGFSLEKYI